VLATEQPNSTLQLAECSRRSHPRLQSILLDGSLLARWCSYCVVPSKRLCADAFKSAKLGGAITCPARVMPA
jgi:hypothetical protein